MRTLVSLSLLLAGLSFPMHAQPAVKKPIRGLTAMGGTGSGGGKPNNEMAELFVHPGVYRGAVINVDWQTIEPKQGVFDFTEIDKGMDALRRYNKAHPSTPAVAKLRVYTGLHAPPWLLPLTKGPLSLTSEKGVQEYGGWWTPMYRSRFKLMQDALAAKYDADPLMGEVAASSCATMTDESFIYPHTPASLKILHAAGFSDAAEQACLMGATDDYANWKLTPLDLSFSPYRKGDDGQVGTDNAFALKVMRHWREVYGERGVLSNHSLQDPISQGLQPIWADLTLVGPPLEGQTASQGVIQHGKETNGQIGEAQAKGAAPIMDWNKVIQAGIDHKCNEIEIWTTVDGGGHAKITQAMLKVWADRLK